MTKILIDRSTVEQALEALEAMTKHFGFARLGSSSLADTMKRGDAHVAMNNLRAALAEPVQEQYPLHDQQLRDDAERWKNIRGYVEEMEREIKTLRAALAEPVQESATTNIGCLGMPVNTPVTPPQQAEPVQEPVAVSERERWAFLLRAAGRVLQAFDDGYLQPDLETLQGSIAVDALRESWAAFAPVRIQGPNCMAAPPQHKENT